MNWSVALLHKRKADIKIVALLLAGAMIVLLAACSQDNAVAVAPTVAVVVEIATAEPTSTQAPTSTPRPTATPDPVALATEAQLASVNGDHESAIKLYSQGLSILQNRHNDFALSARMELGKNQFAAGDLDGASTTFTAVISDAEGTQTAADAHVLLGRIATVSGDSAGAITQYGAALTAQDAISPYLHLWLGDAYIAMNHPVSAVVPYQVAVNAAANPTQAYERREKLALALQLTSNYSAALAQYEAILAFAKYPSTISRVKWESAQVLLAMGKSEPAYQQMREVINQYPQTPAAFSALQALMKDGLEVDDLQRGIVDYYNDAYAAAQQAFRRAIVNDSRTNEVRYWAALNYAASGSPADAYRNLDQIIADGPLSPRYGDAYIEKAALQAAAGDQDSAAATYQALIEAAPSDPQASVALQHLGRMYETAGQLDQAAHAYMNAYTSNPHTEGVAESLLRAAVSLYRLGRYGDAISQSQALVTSYPEAAEVALGQIWMGKAQIAAGQVVSGQAILAALSQQEPDTYEGTRAAELTADFTRVPLSKKFGSLTALITGTDESLQAQAESWLRSKLNISDTVNVRTPGIGIQADTRFTRAAALWRLGLQDEVREEVELLPAAYSGDMLASYQLALYFRDIGAHRASIGAADTLFHQSGVKTIAELPVFIARLIYPIYYPQLIALWAGEYALDPLLVAGLIRQESLFESSAASSASAYGLMQVVPSTGKGIYNELEWPPNYSDRDLTRADVSIRFGTYYLSRQRDRFKGDMVAALAAYNGGPGMAVQWRDRSGGDPDVFYLTMPLDGSGYLETQLYIRTVSTNYAIYHRLYAGD